MFSRPGRVWPRGGASSRNLYPRYYGENVTYCITFLYRKIKHVSFETSRASYLKIKARRFFFLLLLLGLRLKLPRLLLSVRLLRLELTRLLLGRRLRLEPRLHLLDLLDLLLLNLLDALDLLDVLGQLNRLGLGLGLSWLLLRRLRPGLGLGLQLSWLLLRPGLRPGLRLGLSWLLLRLGPGMGLSQLLFRMRFDL